MIGKERSWIEEKVEDCLLRESDMKSCLESSDLELKIWK